MRRIQAQLENVATLGDAAAHNASRPCRVSSSHSWSRCQSPGDFGLAARRSANVRRAGVTERLRPCKESSTTLPASTARESTMVLGMERITDPPERRRVAVQLMINLGSMFYVSKTYR